MYALMLFHFVDIDRTQIQLRNLWGTSYCLAAIKAKEEYDAEKTRLTEPDPRWTRFQAKLFLFPDGADQHADFLTELGEEDNRTQQYVRIRKSWI